VDEWELCRKPLMAENRNDAASSPTEATGPLRVLIVDDEAPARNRIRDLLDDCATKLALHIAGEACSGREALELAPECDADVVLLDVRMPGMDGLEAAQHLQRLDRPPAVIFTTAYDAYALNAFEVHAIDYLVKPIRAERLLSALARVRGAVAPRLELLRELKRDARSHLSINERGRVHLIPVSDIAYLKAELKYVTIRTVKHEFVLEESLAKLEEEFSNGFVRIHRNCLVARRAIAGFERMSTHDGDGNWVVVLKGIDEKLAVSRRQQHIVREFRK
jgi:two-component system response regulator AlgR